MYLDLYFLFFYLFIYFIIYFLCICQLNIGNFIIYFILITGFLLIHGHFIPSVYILSYLRGIGEMCFVFWVIKGYRDTLKIGRFIKEGMGGRMFVPELYQWPTDRCPVPEDLDSDMQTLLRSWRRTRGADNIYYLHFCLSLSLSLSLYIYI